MPRRLSPEKQAQVKALAAADANVSIIAATVGCSHMTVRRLLGTQPKETRRRSWKTVKQLVDR